MLFYFFFITRIEESFFFFFFFQFFIYFFFFFNIKYGETPLYVAAKNGHEQIVQVLLEEGGNVDLADKVILLIVSCSFSFSELVIPLLFYFN